MSLSWPETCILTPPVNPVKASLLMFFEASLLTPCWQQRCPESLITMLLLSHNASLLWSSADLDLSYFQPAITNSRGTRQWCTFPQPSRLYRVYKKHIQTLLSPIRNWLRNPVCGCSLSQRDPHWGEWGQFSNQIPLASWCMKNQLYIICSAVTSGTPLT